MSAHVDSDRTCREHAALGALDQSEPSGGGSCRGARTEPADLDPARDADTQVFALLASFFLLLAELLVPGHLHRLVHRILVRARVVNQAEVACMWKFGDEVLAPDLCRVHVKGAGEQIDHPLA